MLGSGPRDQSSESPRCAIAGQSRSVGASSTASFPSRESTASPSARHKRCPPRSRQSPQETFSPIGRNHVALVVHRRVECEVVILQKGSDGGLIRAHQIDSRPVGRHRGTPRLLSVSSSPSAANSSSSFFAAVTTSPSLPAGIVDTALHSRTAGTRCRSAQVGVTAGCAGAIEDTAQQIHAKEAKEVSRRISLSRQSNFSARLLHDLPACTPESNHLRHK